ncbi:MAG: hypothetical protein ACI8Q1_000160 [Parvicella sp.]|jgi:hypothetical protein
MRLTYSILLLLASLSSCKHTVEVVDRYNYIQRPTENSVTIAWQTEKESSGVLNWGIDKTNLKIQLIDSSLSNEHVFEIDGLVPNTTYYYQTSVNILQDQPIDSFVTANTSLQSDFSFLHYGDCGTGTKIQEKIAKQMQAESVDFGLVAGDVDQGNGNNYDEVFFQKYTHMLRNTCHYTALGNHDGYYDDGQTYLDAFYLPNNNPDSTERYYSFSWGNAKFICLDSNYGHGTPDGEGVDNEKQTAWLKNELKTNTKKWIFIYFHHPPYTIAWTGDYFFPFNWPYRHYQGTDQVQTNWMPLFNEYKVDFVLTGHSHCYQRGELNNTHYVISGGSGTEDNGLLNGYYMGMDRIHVKKDSNNIRIPKEMKKPVKGIVIDGIEIEEYYEVKGILPTVDILIRQSQYVRFDVKEDQVTFSAYNSKGDLIDQVTKVK